MSSTLLILKSENCFKKGTSLFTTYYYFLKSKQLHRLSRIPIEIPAEFLCKSRQLLLLFHFKNICKYLISLKKFYYRKKSWWFYVPLSVLFSSYGGSASIYHLSVIKSYVDSNPDPSGLLTKEQRKIWLLLLAKHWSLNTYLLRITILNIPTNTTT